MCPTFNIQTRLVDSFAVRDVRKPPLRYRQSGRGKKPTYNFNGYSWKISDTNDENGNELEMNVWISEEKNDWIPTRRLSLDLGVGF